MSEPDVQRYLDEIGSQNQRPRFISTLRCVLEKIDGVTTAMKDMPSAFSVENAVGNQLDTLGTIVGADRRFPPLSIPGCPELLTDELFRYVVLAKIAKNNWDGTTETFGEIWRSTLGKLAEAEWRDNQDMSMDVSLTGELDPLMVELVLASQIIPKPMGVHMNTTIISQTEENSSAAVTVASVNDARVHGMIDYGTDKSVNEQTGSSSKMSLDAASVLCRIRYKTDAFACDAYHNYGTSMCACSGHAVFNTDYHSTRESNHVCKSGVLAAANISRIAINTI